MKPSWRISASQSTRSISPVSACSMSTASIRSTPWIARTSYGVRMRARPSSASRRTVGLGRLEATEAVAAVDEVDRPGRRVLQVDRPVERRVATSDDHAAPACRTRPCASRSSEGPCRAILEPRDRQRARLERAMTRGDDQRAREVVAALVGREAPQLLAVDLDALERRGRPRRDARRRRTAAPARPCGRRTPAR